MKEWQYSLLLHDLRYERGACCEECGVKLKRNKRNGLYNLEFAHIKPTGLNGKGRGLRRRYLDIKRNPDAYKLLCFICHRRLDG